MRTLSLKQLHERAIAVLGMIESAKGRIEFYPDQIRRERSHWHNEREAVKLERKMESTQKAMSRLTTHYATIVDRINGTLALSLVLNTDTSNAVKTAA